MRMTALEATISMLRSMPESDILKVKSYVASIFEHKSESPFVYLTKEEILEQLSVSRQQADLGDYQEAMAVHEQITSKYGL